MSHAALIITFSTTYDALAFQAACREGAIEGRLISIPREISAGCGYAWKTSVRDRASIERLIGEKTLGVESMHELELD
ncbi:MAG: DUF3343 domain-containing protein [Raoultibacter sp.]